MAKPTRSKKKTATKKTATKKTAAKKTAAKKPAVQKAAGQKPAGAQLELATPANKGQDKKRTPAAPRSAVPSTVDAADASEAAANDGKTKPAAPGSTSTLSVGDAAPAFSLEASDGKTYTLSGLKGQRFVLYFYPRDNTPGCTQEACDFRDQLSALGLPVFGVSGDSLKSHGRFADKYDLNFPLLSDPDRAVADAYGALGEKSMYGRTVIGIIRSTFVIDAEGRVETVFSPVRVNGHVAAVAQALGAG